MPSSDQWEWQDFEITGDFLAGASTFWPGLPGLPGRTLKLGEVTSAELHQILDAGACLIFVLGDLAYNASGAQVDVIEHIIVTPNQAQRAAVVSNLERPSALTRVEIISSMIINDLIRAQGQTAGWPVADQVAQVAAAFGLRA